MGLSRLNPLGGGDVGARRPIERPGELPLHRGVFFESQSPRWRGRGCEIRASAVGSGSSLPWSQSPRWRGRGCEWMNIRDHEKAPGWLVSIPSVAGTWMRARRRPSPSSREWRSLNPLGGGDLGARAPADNKTYEMGSDTVSIPSVAGTWVRGLGWTLTRYLLSYSLNPLGGGDLGASARRLLPHPRRLTCGLNPLGGGDLGASRQTRQPSVKCAPSQSPRWRGLGCESSGTRKTCR